MKAVCNSELRLLLVSSVIACSVVGSSAQAKLVVCIGDSQTYGAGLPNLGSDCYPAQLARILQGFDHEWEVRNFAVNATCVVKNGPLPYIRQGAFNQARVCNPDVVVIWLGLNDSVPGAWRYKDDFLPDFLELIDGFAALASQPEIYLCYPSPVVSSTPWGHDNNVIRDEIIPLIDQLATLRDVKVIDLHTPLKDSPDLFQGDGLHLNTEGFKLVAQIVAATMIGMRGTPDFNGDEKVDIQDLLILVEHWGQAEPSLDIAPPPFGDGTVDANDLEALIRYWGQEINDPTFVAHWKLDETEGLIAHDSEGGHDRPVIGLPAWKPEGGAVGGALELNGTTFLVADLVLNPKDGPFSAFAWVKGGAPGQAILCQQSGANWLMADAPTGVLKTELSQGGPTGLGLTSQAVITDGNWHRVAFTWDGTNRQLYVDSVLVAEDTQDSLVASFANLVIGTGKNMAPGTFWTGLIDDVRIYKRAVQP